MPECSRLYYDASMVATNAGCYQVAVGAEYRSDEYGWVVCTHPDVEGDWVELASWPWNKFMYGQDMPVNYTGLTYVAYTVLPRPVVEAQAEFVLPLNLIYDGSAKVLAGLTITNDYTGAVLQEGVDYDVVYSDNVNPGMATATVVCKGNYAGTLARTFEILPTSFSLSGCDGGGFAGESGSLTGYAGEYDGEGHGLAVDVSAIGDVTAKFAMAEEGPFVDSLLLTNICDQTVWVELSALGYNSFTGFAQVVISARPITNVTIEAQNIVRSAGGVPELVYSVYDPCLGRSLVDGVDYVAAIEDDESEGKTTIALSGMGNYAGETSAETKYQRSLAGFDAALSQTECFYDGTAKRPVVTVTDPVHDAMLVEGRDFSLAYRNNTNVGTAFVVVTGIGDYTGTRELSFSIGYRKVTASGVTWKYWLSGDRAVLSGMER